jgi:prolyl 4-hydroxylase
VKFFSSKKAGKASPIRRQYGVDVARRLDGVADRVPTEAVQFYHRTDFLSPAECQALIRMIDANRRPSTLLATDVDAAFRTSDSCDMDRWSPDVRPIDERFAELLGIAPEHGETMQGQRYAPGQQFRAHHDYFHEGQAYWQSIKDQGGQRTWTAMVYLNDVPEGGATWFPQAGMRVAPKRGMLLAWNNMKPDGSPNEVTLHEGMPVQRGVKYIVTKWFRERPWAGLAG